MYVVPLLNSYYIITPYSPPLLFLSLMFPHVVKIYCVCF